MYMLRTLPVVLSLSILLPVPMATTPVVRGAHHAAARAVSPGAARGVGGGRTLAIGRGGVDACSHAARVGGIGCLAGGGING